ncbi:MAG: hypothetical protein IJZ66_06905 [Oscillibacter sp.]|nr:hypothetical protein [Oscillibacter sp.]
MLQEIMDLVKAMGSGDWDESLVQRMCQVAQTQLTIRLRPGVTAEDCGGAFPIAAAWMALSTLYACGEADGVESFSAGDLTIRTSGGGRSQSLEDQARKLMAPYCKETAFAVQGVRG